MHDTLTGRDEMIDADDVFNCEYYPRERKFSREYNLAAWEFLNFKMCQNSVLCIQ